MAAEGSILVVDDDPGLLEAVTATLGARYHVETATTAAAAIDAICSRPFDLLLLDHQLPDFPGTEVLRFVKKLFPSTLVIIITGVGSEEVAIQALRGGARDYLRKPFGSRELEARVRTLLGLRRTSVERRRNPLVEASILKLPQGAPCADDPETAECARALIRALRLIDEHLEDALRLAEVARVAGMSKFHFCRRFQAYTGQRFSEFLARRRIERAKELMRHQGRTLTDIFRDDGFKDMTHFGRVFKRLEGQLPSEFRRHTRDDAPESVPSSS
jgi:two-component system response regulator YesN